MHHDADSIHAETTSTSSYRKDAPHPTCITFSRDSSLLLSTQSDSTVLLYNTNTSKQINVYRQLELGVSLLEPTQQRYAVVCAPARKGHQSEAHKKLSPELANRLFCWDLHTNTTVGFLQGHINDIQSIDTCYSDEAIVSADVLGTVRLWDLRSGIYPTATTVTGAKVPCAACFNRTGNVLAIAGVDDKNQPQVSMFDRRHLSGGALSATHHRVWKNASIPIQAGGKGSMNGFSKVQFSPDATAVTITPFESSGGTKRRREDRPPRHTLLIRGSAEMEEEQQQAKKMPYNLIDLKDTQAVRENTQQGGRPYRPGIAFSPDSKIVIFGDDDKMIQVWKRMTTAEIAEEGVRKKEKARAAEESGVSWGSGTRDGVEMTVSSDGNDGSSSGGGGGGGGGGSASTLYRVAGWRGHIQSVGPVQWSPTTELVASGGGNLLMWLPQEGDKSEGGGKSGKEITDGPSSSSNVKTQQLKRSFLRDGPIKSVLKKVSAYKPCKDSPSNVSRTHAKRSSSQDF